MVNKELLQALFVSHLADLKDVFPKAESFICPICLSEFTQEDISSENISHGHVWPKYIRKKSSSKIATLQRVLLCKKCNSTAGSRGDEAMRIREQLKENYKAGIFEGRRIEIIRELGEKPIVLQADFKLRTGDTVSGSISFVVNKRTGVWKYNNPEERDKFLSITDGKDKFTVIIYPPDGVKSEFAPVGWITGAYLLAFYTFGYRYIFHESSDIVRQYILDSFDDTKRASLTIPTLENFSLTECKEHYYSDPEINIAVPLDGKSPVHLQINYLDYHIILPFHFIPNILLQVLTNVPEFKELAKKALENDAHLFVRIEYNKSIAHNCLWDYVLGKPIQ